ncbi:hypothetical protein [Pontibacter arcticus]|uniref:Uncharacterized protein n=1 Tax=Pontibacter arcticus TaxID=2080288 RepID=A0A364RIJ4_9BACT|nr:hypothetical protein [Pontibacter arcticus]RAU84058.1 hypothetical protein DP923_03120 [Pontibacter arcticus]
MEADPKLIEAIANILWPIIVMVIAIMLFPLIRKIILNASEIKFKVGDYEFTATKQTIEVLIKPVLNELDDAVSILNDRQKELFLEIYNNIYVHEEEVILSQSFERDSEYHKDLRVLRNVNFVRPYLGGKWNIGKRIEVKNFGVLAGRLKAKELKSRNNNAQHSA